MDNIAQKYKVLYCLISMRVSRLEAATTSDVLVKLMPYIYSKK